MCLLQLKSQVSAACFCPYGKCEHVSCVHLCFELLALLRMLWCLGMVRANELNVSVH